MKTKESEKLEKKWRIFLEGKENCGICSVSKPRKCGDCRNQSNAGIYEGTEKVSRVLRKLPSQKAQR